MKQSIIFLSSLMFALWLPLAADAIEQTPDGTFTLEVKSVGVGVGYKWGKGTLKYQGKEIDFSVKGIELISAGAGITSATGTITGLDKLADFTGTYRAGSVDVSLGTVGKGVGALYNNRGVKLNFSGKQKGLKFAYAPGGMSVQIDQVREAARAGVPEVGKKISDSLMGLTRICGCPLRINVDWETFDQTRSRRSVADTINGFVSAASGICKDEQKKKAFCENYEQLDVVFDDKKTTGVARRGNTIRALNTETKHVSADMFIDFLTVTN